MIDAPKLAWQFLPQWAAWWLMIEDGGATAKRGYGPFVNDFEIQCAADVYGVPFTGDVSHEPA